MWEPYDIKRAERADKVLECISNYLDVCGWVIDKKKPGRIDPLTKKNISAPKALYIQISRDLSQ
jgi:hypothetical protein